VITIIYPDRGYFNLPVQESTKFEYLRVWIGCDLIEIVNIQVNGEQQLAVDEEGIMNFLQLNPEATKLYRASSIAQGWDEDQLPAIHGVAVLLTDENLVE